MTPRSAAAPVEELSGRVRSISMMLAEHAEGLAVWRRNESRLLHGMAEQLAAIADRLIELRSKRDAKGLRRLLKWTGVFLGTVLLHEVPADLLSDVIIEKAKDIVSTVEVVGEMSDADLLPAVTGSAENTLDPFTGTAEGNVNRAGTVEGTASATGDLTTEQPVVSQSATVRPAPIRATVTMPEAQAVNVDPATLNLQGVEAQPGTTETTTSPVDAVGITDTADLTTDADGEATERADRGNR